LRDSTALMRFPREAKTGAPEARSLLSEIKTEFVMDDGTP
jgi:hypothetical protein